MTRKLLFAGLVALVAAIAIDIAWQLKPEPEPVYKGKSLTPWLQEYANLDDPENPTNEEVLATSVACKALREIGTNAVPALLRMIGTPDRRPLTGKLVDFAEAHQIIHHRLSPNELRWLAETGFEVLGADARGALPSLEELAQQNSSGETGSCIARAIRYVQPPPVTLGQVSYDFNHDGLADSLSLVWLGGRHYLDQVPWCGEGEKYEGAFVFRVQFGNGPTVDTPVDIHFIPADDTQPWPIVISDFNNDGQADFNIVTYGGCSGDDCSLFTVMPSGKVQPLKGAESLPVEKSGVHSTSEFDGQFTTNGFYYEWFYYPAQERTIYVFEWDAQEHSFHTHEMKIELRWP